MTLEYWIKALALNTGDDKVSDLIYWPEQYLGDGYDGPELTPAEILDIALTKRRSAENQSKPALRPRYRMDWATSASGRFWTVVTVRNFSCSATCYSEPNCRDRPEADIGAGTLLWIEN